MKIAIIGLGKMGLNLALNLQQANYEVITVDKDNIRKKIAKDHGLCVVATLEEAVISFPDTQPKIIWLMLPAGEITQSVIQQLHSQLSPGDILIDGGNSYYKHSVENGEKLSKAKIHFVDIGTSGGTSGALNGACLMVGCEADIYNFLEPILTTISIQDGLLYCGPNGSGHYLKMIHNGIEYGMMQAIGEGFELLHAGPFDYNLADVANVWNHGSVIRSWLMELACQAFDKNKNLHNIQGKVPASGEGKWTVEEALELEIPVPVISLSLMMRNRSLQEDSFSGKVVAALRNGFGDHPIQITEEE